MKRVILNFLLLILFIGYANAAKVAPVKFELSIPRGQTQEFVLNLMGSVGEKNQNLVIYPSDFSMARNGALCFDLIKDSKNSAVKWIKINENKLTLVESQEKKVVFKISVPFEAVPGEYYAVVMVEPESFTKIKDTGNKPVVLKMKTRVAVVITIEVPGRIYEKKGEVSEIRILETEKLVKITSAFSNTSDIHLDVSGKAIIRSVDSRINYGEFPIRALSSSKDEAFIFPKSVRDFEGSLDRQLPSGEYLVEVIYSYGDMKKSKKIEKFSINRKVSVNEKDNEFLSLKNKEFNLYIPSNGRRTQVVSLTNTDYRDLNIDVVIPDDWVKVIPNKLVLKPGEVRNIMFTLSASGYDEKSQMKESTVCFKTDRGKPSDLKFRITGVKEKEKTENEKSSNL
jgi:hypothetical protein